MSNPRTPLTPIPMSRQLSRITERQLSRHIERQLTRQLTQQKSLNASIHSRDEHDEEDNDTVCQQHIHLIRNISIVKNFANILLILLNKASAYHFIFGMISSNLWIIDFDMIF